VRRSGAAAARRPPPRDRRSCSAGSRPASRTAATPR